MDDLMAGVDTGDERDDRLQQTTRERHAYEKGGRLTGTFGRNSVNGPTAELRKPSCIVVNWAHESTMFTSSFLAPLGNRLPRSRPRPLGISSSSSHSPDPVEGL